MNGRVRLIVCLSGLAVAGPFSQAQAQFYSQNPCNQCAQPVPVVQSCYQSVPVTEYRTEKQTVQRPVYETEYVDQQVTAYRPVTEVKTASIPTTTYQDVVECQTVQRDYSRWVTNYQPRQSVSPCQYDNRPTITGWINRTAYSIRNSFTPRYTASRQYVPNVVAYNVPVTRRIPTTVMRQVNYNVTKMVPYTETRKVAVQKVRYETVQVDVVRPVTVMRTVPTGTTVAYSYSPYGMPTATAMAPIPDPISAQRATPSRTADASNGTTIQKKFERSRDDEEGDGDAPIDNLLNDTRTYSEPIRKETASPANANGGQNARRYSSDAVEHEVAFRPSVPSIVRVSGWKARTQAQMAKSSGPKLASPQIQVVNNR
ncbi:MAG: hypothetical protein O2955_01440 [Planctomycetota bacterium]|nr:hypothetical protein [Planctomycetota bacterium]MDA1211146.1 hypothetical protein [Planctomycetota bacterium]